MLNDLYYANVNEHEELSMIRFFGGLDKGIADYLLQETFSSLHDMFERAKLFQSNLIIRHFNQTYGHEQNSCDLQIDKPNNQTDSDKLSNLIVNMNAFEKEMLRLNDLLHTMKKDSKTTKVLQPNVFKSNGLCELILNPDMHETEIPLHDLHVQPYEVSELIRNTSLETEIGGLQSINNMLTVDIEHDKLCLKMF